MHSHPSFSLSILSVSVISAFLMTNSFSAHAETDPFDYPELKTSQMDFGGVCLMQMPTGRMAPEGEFNFGASFNNEYYFYSASL